MTVSLQVIMVPLNCKNFFLKSLKIIKAKWFKGEKALITTNFNRTRWLFTVWQHRSITISVLLPRQLQWATRLLLANRQNTDDITHTRLQGVDNIRGPGG